MKHKTQPSIPSANGTPAPVAQRRGPQPIDPKQLAQVAGGVSVAVAAPKGTWSLTCAPKGTWA